MLIAEHEEEGQSVIKDYRSELLAENLDDEKRLARSRRQVMNNKKTREKNLELKKIRKRK